MALIDTAEIGRKGGLATAAKLSKEERSESARKAVNARWAAVKKAEEPKAKKKAGKGGGKK
jgi:hypothetical protein